MTRIAVRLLGKFSATVDGKPLTSLTSSKVQELFAYLLIHRGRPHSREVLSTLLWGDSESCRAKKYLRQALWQLQSVLRPLGPSNRAILCIDPEWIELRALPELWLDIGVLEEAHASTVAMNATAAIANEDLDRLRTAVALYEDHLLTGWYHDWCSFERERLQNIHQSLLDVLMGDCEARGRVEEGLRYGALSLRHDRARERTHQRLMRFHCRSGDRAAALRQYDRCVISMDEELGVAPAEETRVLYEEIRAGRADTVEAMWRTKVPPADVSLRDLFDRLTQIGRTLDDYRLQVESSLQAVELALDKSRPAREAVRRRQNAVA